jgi:hypothetical protein
MDGKARSDVPILLENDQVEVRTLEAGGMTMGFFRLAKGTDMGPALVGMEGDSCPCPHWGYMIEGALTMRTPDGERTYTAGQAFYWPPGHVPVAIEDCSYVDFSPTEELRAVTDHIMGGG